MLKTTIFWKLLPIWGRREWDWTTDSLRFARSFTLSQFERPLSRKEGLDRSVAFSSLTFSLNTRAFSLTPRRERDWTRRSLRFNSIPLSLGERGIGQDVHFVSRLALRVTAGGRNPWPRWVRFALARSIEPSARVLIHPLFHLKQKAKPFGFAFCFKGERGIRTLGPVTDSGFRDRPIRPLWHLSEVCII